MHCVKNICLRQGQSLQYFLHRHVSSLHMEKNEMLSFLKAVHAPHSTIFRAPEQFAKKGSRYSIAHELRLRTIFCTSGPSHEKRLWLSSRSGFNFLSREHALFAFHAFLQSHAQQSRTIKQIQTLYMKSCFLVFFKRKPDLLFITFGKRVYVKYHQKQSYYFGRGHCS